jgi:rsbT co-antagonist protein RsbR
MNPNLHRPPSLTKLPELLHKHEADLLTQWLAQQQQATDHRTAAIPEAELHEQSRTFLVALCSALQQTGSLAINDTPPWTKVYELLSTLSRLRARQGFTPSETATFIFSLKQPLFDHLRQEYLQDPEALAAELWAATVLLDKLGLYTMEVFQQSREEMLERQKQEMLELSTPVVRLWEGILALPLIGTLDSERTQIVMENLLQKIVETGSGIAIIDITGVPIVDTLVAQHLLKTVAAARLMGADCIISGIRPQIAQTIVHLGVDLANIITKATLADAFLVALQRTNQAIVRTTPRTESR